MAEATLARLGVGQFYVKVGNRPAFRLDVPAFLIGNRHALSWEEWHGNCEYSPHFYVKGYKPAERKTYPFRDMDFVKDKVGVEVQFGKYAFMVYNVCAKMTIFRNFGHIETGIEIVPIKELAEHMSTGVSYFEQFVWDLEKLEEYQILTFPHLS